MLGYEKRSNPFLPEETLRGVFTLAGIVRPSILLDGKIVGVWKRRGKAVELTWLMPLQSLQCKRIEEEALRTFRRFGLQTGLEGLSRARWARGGIAAPAALHGSKGEFSFTKEKPPEKGLTLQASSSKSCNACRLHFPARGVAAFGSAIRFGLLLLPAAALLIS